MSAACCSVGQCWIMMSGSLKASYLNREHWSYEFCPSGVIVQSIHCGSPVSWQCCLDGTWLEPVRQTNWLGILALASHHQKGQSPEQLPQPLLLNDWLLSDASIEKLLESRNHRLLPLAKILTWSTHVQSLMHGLHLWTSYNCQGSSGLSFDLIR